MKISFVGSGNVGWHMARALEKANHSIVEVYSKNRKNASRLTQKLYNASVAPSLDFSKSKAEVFIIAVPDDAIESVALEMIVPESTIVVHTSGTMEIDILDSIQKAQTGVFYPLQTFTRLKAVNFKSIPICIEAKNEKTEKILSKLAFTICDNVGFFNSHDRSILHLAAVFSCNFTNRLLSISKEILEKEGLNFAILYPLIRETIDKAIIQGPESSQTGPAARKDFKTIKRQSDELKKDPSIKSIYDLITQNIIEIPLE